MTGSGQDLGSAGRRLEELGVAGLTIAWADMNGIPRSRTVPVARVADAASWGVGITPLFAVFDTHDGITYAYEGLPNASGDIRLVAVPERVRRLAGQPALAWAPGRQLAADGSPWPYDQRGALERQVARASALGLEVRAGYEIEIALSTSREAFAPAHHGPAYSPHGMLEVDGLVGRLLRDLAANGLAIGQIHAEYGAAQLELSLPATDPVSAADDQLLARQTIHAAARAEGLHAILAPLAVVMGAGNGWHVHTSVSRDGRNLLHGDGPHGLAPEGAAWIAGILRDLPAIAAVTAPSAASLIRRRPGWFASAYAFWGVENREAALRLVPGSPLTGGRNANVELKPSDASGNPYLALAALIAAGLAGIEEGLALPDPIQADPGAWSDDERAAHGVRRLPATPAEQEEALCSSPRVTAALGSEIVGAFLAVRRADAAWAEGKTDDEVVEAHRWRY